MTPDKTPDKPAPDTDTGRDTRTGDPSTTEKRSTK